ncbi:hypothetical protein [Bacillus suaedaesalsae]|uniref:DUF4468 domain-containing protein n=1 Tax=Bacillus suaedaesalsae TaxID=2810349 RepID=A0ABS2DFE0_9BACI|nr:hypothetical protein [Bacillus suaedaesalsae]MBM6617178.1 hypothetical protein [Bacillus suaedaesalsae]
MRNKFKPNILFLLFVALLLAGCSEHEVNLEAGDKNVTEVMDEVISDYIIEKYSPSYHGTEKQFEVHKVYGTNEVDGIISVYMWSYYGGFNKSTGIENQAGHSLPVVIRLSKKEGNYSVIEYTEPQDGSLYQSSLKRMFPEKYLKLAQQDSGNIEDLQKEMDKKVKQWLEKKE